MNEFHPKVSIVIPVYNGSNYLREAIDSALAQTYKNMEVIVVNDGSNDGGKTEEIAKSYDDKIRYFFKENGGVASALNLGIREMTGDYFSWLSHDDVYLPNKLEAQVFALRNETVPVILYGDYYLINGKSKVTGLRGIRHLPPEQFLYSIITSFPVNGCTTLIPRSCFDEVGFFNDQLRTTQDYEMWVRLSQKYKFVHIGKALIQSRIHMEQGVRAHSDAHLSEANDFFIRCLTIFSVDTIFASRTQSKAMCYLSLAIKFKERGFMSASQYAFTLTKENLVGLNTFARVSGNMLLASYRRIPRVFLPGYWKLIAKSLIERKV